MTLERARATRRDPIPGDTEGPGQEHSLPPAPFPLPFPNPPPPALQCPPGIWYKGGFVPCVTSGYPPLTVQLPGGQNQFGKPTQSLKTHWDQWLGYVTAVQVAPGKRPPPCPHPRDSPVGVEEDVDEHGGDGGQRVGGHRQDTEAGLGALHGVQRGAGSWQGNGRASSLGTARGQSRSATPWPPRPQPGVSQGAEGWPGGPKGCGYHRWELQHLGGDWVALGVPQMGISGGNWSILVGSPKYVSSTGRSRSILAGTGWSWG